MTAVLNTPRTPAELVPGDPDGLAVVAQRWRAVAGAGGDARHLAETMAQGYATLASRLADLRSRAEQLFAHAESLGVGAALVSDAEVVRARMAAAPDLADDIEAAVRTAIDLRLEWVDVEHDFLDALRPVADEVGIPFGEPPQGAVAPDTDPAS